MKRFEKGNIVRIVKRTHGHGFKIGELVVITRADFTDYQAKIPVSSSNVYSPEYWILDEEIAPIALKKLKIL